MRIHIRDGKKTLLLDETQIESVHLDPDSKNLRIRTYSGDTWNLDITLPSIEATFEYLATKSVQAIEKDHYTSQLKKFQAHMEAANDLL